MRMGCNVHASGNAFEARELEPVELKPTENADQIVMDLVNFYDSASVEEMFGNALINLQLNPESWMKEVMRLHDNFIRNRIVPRELVALHEKLGLGQKMLAVE